MHVCTDLYFPLSTAPPNNLYLSLSIYTFFYLSNYPSVFLYLSYPINHLHLPVPGIGGLVADIRVPDGCSLSFVPYRLSLRACQERACGHLRAAGGPLRVDLGTGANVRRRVGVVPKQRLAHRQEGLRRDTGDELMMMIIVFNSCFQRVIIIIIFFLCLFSSVFCVSLSFN